MSPASRVNIRRCDTQEDLETCKRLRWTVFVEEQNVPPSLEHDEHDRLPAPGETRAPVHALAELIEADGRTIPCAAGRLIWKSEARARGARRFTLGAQLHARGFYEGAGYVAIGDIFDDAGIPHVTMEKDA